MISRRCTSPAAARCIASARRRRDGSCGRSENNVRNSSPSPTIIGRAVFVPRRANAPTLAIKFPGDLPMPDKAMRLTLRTLLAYLDDTLEPSQAKLIGQKVAESDTAQELIARIKQVTRRRRLTTPPPAGGPGGKIDANTIAEYLDNSVSAEQLAEVEQICLASDVHLAEVAACHQILTLIMGEPALVPPTAKQRMYTLVKGPESIPFRKPAKMVSKEDQDLSSEIELDQDDSLRMG